MIEKPFVLVNLWATLFYLEYIAKYYYQELNHLCDVNTKYIRLLI